MRCDYLNHASVLVEDGDIRLLSDPWFEGTAFSGGWGLRYDNPDALARAAGATHLWISHWHSDHLHVPTLTRLAKVNPRMVVLANVAANFTMVDRLSALGFEDVRPIEERRPMALAPGVTVTRYPTAGIDNILHLSTPTSSVLNYNDANLPRRAIRDLLQKVGPVDLLLTNYNHAGKLFDYGGAATEKARLWSVLRGTVDVIAPEHVVPFASSHYYRTNASFDQNASLLSFDELAEGTATDPRYVVLRVGDEATFDRSAPPAITRREPPLADALANPESIERHDYGDSVSMDELVAGADRRCQTLKRRFFGATLLLPRLRIRLTDQDGVLELSRTGAKARHEAAADVAAHSRAVHTWLCRPFGDDTFVAGAHFTIETENTTAIRRWALFTLLEASHLDPRRVAGFLFEPEGRHFLWARREEIAATAIGLRFRAGEIRL